MPQLDEPASLPMRDPLGRRVQEDSSLVGQEYSQGGTYYKKPPYQEGGNIQEKVVMMTILIEGHIEIKDPLSRWRHPNQSGRPPDQRRIP